VQRHSLIIRPNPEQGGGEERKEQYAYLTMCTRLFYFFIFALKMLLNGGRVCSTDGENTRLRRGASNYSYLSYLMPIDKLVDGMMMRVRRPGLTALVLLTLLELRFRMWGCGGGHMRRDLGGTVDAGRRQ